MDKRLRDEVLARIKDPTVREHYEAKLDMADEVEGLRTGGIFDVPGVPASARVALPEVIGRERAVVAEERAVPGNSVPLAGSDALSRRERMLYMVLGVIIGVVIVGVSLVLTHWVFGD